MGLDVVKLALDSLGGQLRVESELGEGTTFTLVLPTSIAVKGALLVEVEERPYAVPLLHTDTVLALHPSQISVVGGVLVTHLQDQAVPLVPLRAAAARRGRRTPAARRLKPTLQGTQQVLVVNYNNRRLGLLVDRFHAAAEHRHQAPEQAAGYHRLVWGRHAAGQRAGVPGARCAGAHPSVSRPNALNFPFFHPSPRRCTFPYL